MQAVDEINGSPLDAVGPQLPCASAKIAPEKTEGWSTLAEIVSGD